MFDLLCCIFVRFSNKFFLLVCVLEGCFSSSQRSSPFRSRLVGVLIKILMTAEEEETGLNFRHQPSYRFVISMFQVLHLHALLAVLTLEFHHDPYHNRNFSSYSTIQSNPFAACARPHPKSTALTSFHSQTDHTCLSK